MLLLLDNYDSFTYNLHHYLMECGAAVEVRRNDALSVADVLEMAPEALVISPGPGIPDNAGICLDLIETLKNQPIPLLGVCLGHQAIGESFGGRVEQAPPMHGKISPVHHHGEGVFNGLPTPFNATRYHSLIVAREGLPDCLKITAETNDGTIMGLQHTELPFHGVQFHPESIASEHGHQLLKNFLEISY